MTVGKKTNNPEHHITLHGKIVTSFILQYILFINFYKIWTAICSCRSLSIIVTIIVTLTEAYNIYSREKCWISFFPPWYCWLILSSLMQLWSILLTILYRPSNYCHLANDISLTSLFKACKHIHWYRKTMMNCQKLSFAMTFSGYII